MSITGEPCALKGASTVRWGANGKGRMTYLASGLPNSCEDFQTTTVGDFAMHLFQTTQIEIHEVERALQSPRGMIQTPSPSETEDSAAHHSTFSRSSYEGYRPLSASTWAVRRE